MPRALLLALALAAPARAGDKAVEAAFQSAVLELKAQPAPTPEAAAVNVMKYLRQHLRYAPDVPAARGAHEWSGRQALSAGTVNGCVESAKAFFELYRAATPGYKALFIGSFDAVAEGGHAVVEVTGSDGRGRLVDATSFERLPGPPLEVTDAELSRPLDIAPGRQGRVLQFRGRADLFVTKKDGRYRLERYPYQRVFSGAPSEEKGFDTVEALNAELRVFAQKDAVDFRWLEEHGLILPYVDAAKTGFLYASGEGGNTLHVIFACDARLHEPDDAEQVEPPARASYARTGKAGGCDWTKAD